MQRDSFKTSYGRRISNNRYATLQQIDKMNQRTSFKNCCYWLVLLSILAFCCFCFYKIDVTGQNQNFDEVLTTFVSDVSPDAFKQVYNSSLEIGKKIRDEIAEKTHDFEEKYHVSENILEGVNQVIQKTTTWTEETFTSQKDGSEKSEKTAETTTTTEVTTKSEEKATPASEKQSEKEQKQDKVVVQEKEAIKEEKVEEKVMPPKKEETKKHSKAAPEVK